MAGMPSMTTIDDPSQLPAVSGAYALVIDLPDDVVLPIVSLGKPALRAGRYIYAGSANGPGGLKARLSRHLKAAKAIRWHVDYLTNIAGVYELAAIPDGNECQIVDALSTIEGVSIPHPGFGSSDCKACQSHFLAVPDDLGANAVIEVLKTEGIFWRRHPASCSWSPQPKP